MKKDKDEQEFLAAVRRALDGGGDQLDAATRHRLARARMRAVEEGFSPKTSRRRFRLLAPFVATLAMVLVAAALFFQGGSGVTPPATEMTADLEIITAAEAPDFYADLEFYQWLAEGEEHAG
ncbi:MAG: DUF3619 family protein [Thermodesulfobacteriota bacterium]